MDNLGTTNMWLAILAVVSVLEFVMIVTAGVCAYRMYQRVMTVVEKVERTHIVPLRARVDGMLDEVQLMIAKLKQAQESVGVALSRVSGVGTIVAGSVKARAWPLLGIIQGVRAAVATLKDQTYEPHELGSSRRSRG